ncbi:hypothetical protein C0Q70_18286 [Pomacea canaliculata]|uniref:Uncharacterized protein n=1 Tax=Pomacea canaliculata TaxID=400727 RepID=A0A2T7NMT9_POMCA|nr:hypothetical protein C0Q70_18286 [Pomacea canaliculata]
MPKGANSMKGPPNVGHWHLADGTFILQPIVKTEENNRFTFNKLSFVLKKPARRIPFEIRV